MKFWKFWAFLIVVSLLLAACTQAEKNEDASNNGEKTDVEQTNGKPAAGVEDVEEAASLDAIMDQPVELNVYYPYSDSSYDSFMNGYGSFIHEIYPNITFNWINAQTIEPSELLVTRQPVDLVYGVPTMIQQFKDSENVTDLDPYIIKYNFDLERVKPITIDLVRDQTDHSLMGLAAYINTHLLFYNREIFDKFGEAYPKDGMTWDEVYEISKNMTRIEDGIQYLGFNYYFLTGTFLTMNPYGQPWIEPGTNRVIMSEGKWPEIFRNFQRFYEIPGMEDIRGTDAVNAFAAEERIAMQITLSNRISSSGSSVPDDWDIVSFPVFPDNPGIGAGVDPIYMFIPETSEQKDEAFLSIVALLEDESQIGLLKRGRLPSVEVENLEYIIENEIPFLEGKNAKALLVNDYPPALIVTKEAHATRAILGRAFTAVISGESDINTALREATEEATNVIKELEIQ